jgi:pimeloyl-ACP methyl ester carboxylesterase
MPGYAVESTVGRIQAGEIDYFWRPTNMRSKSGALKCGLIMLHGSGSPNEYVDPNNQAASVRLAAAIATAGIPCIAGDMGGQGWANDTVMSRITSAWTFMQTQYSIRTDKVLLLGCSMGGSAVLRYAQLHPTNVAGVLGLLPLTDLVGFYTGNVGGSQAQIGTAWGVTAPAALPSAANIAGLYATAVGIPYLAAYSTVDTLVSATTVVNYAALVGGTTVVVDSTYGHSDAAIAGMPISQVISFLIANGA